MTKNEIDETVELFREGLIACAEASGNEPECISFIARPGCPASLVVIVDDSHILQTITGWDVATKKEFWRPPTLHQD